MAHRGEQLVTMTGEEYREIRESMGLSQHTLARRLGVHVSTISKRESGKILINSEAELALRYFLIHHRYRYDRRPEIEIMKSVLRSHDI